MLTLLNLPKQKDPLLQKGGDFVLKLMAGDPRIELGLPVPESYGVKTKQYFMDHLGLFCSGINRPLDHTGLLKDRMLQEVVRKKSGNYRPRWTWPPLYMC